MQARLPDTDRQASTTWEACWGKDSRGPKGRVGEACSREKGSGREDAEGGATASVATESKPERRNGKGGRRRRKKGRAATGVGGDATTMKRHQVEEMQAGEGSLAARRKKERAAGEAVRCVAPCCHRCRPSAARGECSAVVPAARPASRSVCASRSVSLAGRLRLHPLPAKRGGGGVRARSPCATSGR